MRSHLALAALLTVGACKKEVAPAVSVEAADIQHQEIDPELEESLGKLNDHLFDTLKEDLAEELNVDPDSVMDVLTEAARKDMIEQLGLDPDTTMEELKEIVNKMALEIIDEE